MKRSLPAYLMCIALLAGCSAAPSETAPETATQPMVKPATPAKDAATADPADHPTDKPPIESTEPASKPPVSTGSPEATVEIAEPVATGRAIAASLRGVLQSDHVLHDVDWSPDGKWLLTSGKLVELSDLSTGDNIRTFGPGAGAMFINNGSQVVAQRETSLVVWNTTSVKQMKTLPLPAVLFEDKGAASAKLKLTAGGAMVLVVAEKAAVVCDLNSGTVREIDLKALDINLMSGSISHDGATLAFGGKYGAVTLVDATTLKKEASFEVRKGYEIASVAFSPGNKKLATVAGTSRVHVCTWDVASQQKLSELQSTASDGELRYSPGGGMLALLANELTIFNISDNILSPQLNYTGYGYSGGAFSPDGQSLAVVAGGDDHARLYNLHPGPAPFTLPERPSQFHPLPGDGNAILLSRGTGYLLTGGKVRAEFGGDDFDAEGVGVSPKGDMFVCYGESLTWWSVASGEKIRETEGFFQSAVFSPDGAQLLASEDGSVWEFDAATGKKGREFVTGAASNYALAISPDGQWLAVGGGSDVYLFDYKTAEAKHRALTQNGMVTRLSYSSGGKWLVSAGEDDNAVAVWKMGEDKPRIFEHDASMGGAWPDFFGLRVAGAVLPPGNEHLITATTNGHIHVWNIAAGKRIASRVGPRLQSIHLITGGNALLALERNSSQAARWDVASLTPARPNSALLESPQVARNIEQRSSRYWGVQARFEGSSRSIQRVTVSPDESLAATLENNGHVILWDLPAIRSYVQGEAKNARSAFTPTAAASRFIVGRFDVDDLAYAYGIYFSEDGKKLAAVGGTYTKGKVTFWNVEDGEEIESFELPSRYDRIAYAPAAGIVVLGSETSSTVRRFDINTAKELPEIEFTTRPAVAVDSAGTQFVLAAGGVAGVFDLKTGKKAREFPVGGRPEAMAVSPDGSHVVMVEDTRQLTCYDFASGKITWRKTMTFACDKVAYTRDGRFVLAAGSKPGLYHAATGEFERGAQLSIDDVQFLKDKKTLLTVGLRLSVVSLPELAASAKQEAIAKITGFHRMYRSGEHLLIEKKVNGRQSVDLFTTLRDIKQPVKLDLRQSENFDAATLMLLKNNPHIYGIALPPLELEPASIAVLKSLPNLEELAVDSCSNELVAALPQMKALRIFSMKSNEVHEENGFAPLAKCANLETVGLVLDSDNAVAAIKALPSLPLLRDAQIAWDELSASAIRFLGTKLPALETLRIECDDLNSKAPAIASLTGIKQLSLAGDFNGESLQHLKNLKLIGLDISGTEVSNNAAALAEIKTLRWCKIPASDDYEFLEEAKEAAPGLRVVELVEEY